MSLSRASRVAVVTGVASVTLTVAVALTEFAVRAGGGGPYASLVIGLFCLALTVFAVNWLGRRLDAIWARDVGLVSMMVQRIADGTFTYTLAATAASFVLYLTARLLFLPPDRLDVPLQPILTLSLSALWVGYTLYSLNRLVSVDDGPRDDAFVEGKKEADLFRFAKASVGGAIALSIYFLLPLEWLVNASHRALSQAGFLVGSGEDFRFSPVHNSAVDWLQTTAIPSIVAIGFGFLTAYVTSLVWYEFYRKLSGAGLEEVDASRQGRNPSRNHFWFNQLDAANSRVVLIGATLGGWFGPWERFRSSLKAALGRETIDSILLMLPDPGGPFFWQRREDEVSRQPLLREDPVARLASAIESLYLWLPSGDPEASANRLAAILKGDGDFGRFSEFRDAFAGVVAGHLRSYESVQENKSFSHDLAENLKTRGSSSAGPLAARFRVRFASGMMMGVNVFDTTIYYVPYLPGVKDKDCPQFKLKSHTPLGSSLDRSFAAMERTAFHVVDREDVVWMAFRLWSACRRHASVLDGLADVPVWLSRASELLRDLPPESAVPAPLAP